MCAKVQCFDNVFKWVYEVQESFHILYMCYKVGREMCEPVLEHGCDCSYGGGSWACSS